MKLRVGILGATGAVGQKFVSLLAEHPWFEVTVVAASERSAGRDYSEAVNWIEEGQIPDAVAGLEVQLARPDNTDLDCDFVFSGLDASVAGDVEEALARAGYPVISNAKNFRMAADVPLLIPEVNPDHLALIDRQDWGSDGFIVTNPNCASVGLAMALKPLHDAFGLEKVHVTTMQALSGAGYPGVASLDALGNVVPFIGGEEDKVETEPLKLLGGLDAPASFTVSAQCNRVPVVDGHLATVSLSFEQRSVSIKAISQAIQNFRPPSETTGLPFSPSTPLQLLDVDNGPQPRTHVGQGNGMTVTIGRLRPCPILGVKFVCLVHNTVRGAAGGAILNAELLASRGRLERRQLMTPQMEN